MVFNTFDSCCRPRFQLGEYPFLSEYILDYQFYNLHLFLKLRNPGLTGILNYNISSSTLAFNRLLLDTYFLKNEI